MIKIIRSSILMLIGICVFTGVTMRIQAAAPEPLKVGDKQTYATLNAAIAAAQEGQVIQIVSNVTETNPANPVLINKRVTIQGDTSSIYTIKGWAKGVSPFQITAAGVIIQDLNIVINGAATTCSPIAIIGDKLGLKRTKITLTGTASTVFNPILVDASGLTMEDVTIPSTARAPVLVDLLGNSAVLREVSITAGANTTGLYSATSPANLVLDACVFTATANTATLISLPSPDGLTLAGCTFSFNFSTVAGTGYGLNFTEASAATATKTFKANGCIFNMNALATAIHLNGYNGVFTDCEFNYSKGGTGIFSQSPSNADLTFANSAFYIGKNSGERPASAKGLDLKNNERGNIMIDGCTLIASCNPEAEKVTTAASALIINSTDGTLRGLTIHNSSIALNAGATTATGVSANTELLTITKSNFKANARTARCVAVNGITSGNVSGSVFDIAQVGTAGLQLTNSNTVNLKDNIYSISTGGTGVDMSNTEPGTSGVVVDKNEINIQGQTNHGLLLENVGRLDVKNGTTIQAVGGGKNSVGIKANQVKTVEINGLELDINGVTQGIVIDGTKFPQGEEGSARITNTTAKISGGAAKAISAVYANGVLIDNYHGVCDETAVGAVSISFNSSIGVNINNSTFELYNSSTGINVAATTTIAEPTDENGAVKKHISGNYEIHSNGFYVGEKAKAIFFGGRDTHNVMIRHNLLKANKAAGIVTVGYGRSQIVHNNVFESVDSMMAIVSDGIDEIKSFAMEVDSDVYADSEIVDSYRNQFYNNQLKGSYERGLYITNNGDVVRDNDFSEATFHYESTPGRIANTQIIVAYCKDVKILNNRFTRARSADNPVIRIYNAFLSEVTGNTTQTVGDASEVLFAQGTEAVAPNGLKYPEEIAVHDTTNTINGVKPVEIVREWRNPENLIYEYVLQIPKYSYSVMYYKDFVSDENLIAAEQGYSGFAEGHILKYADVAADLGEDWLALYRPADYSGEIVSNINSMIIQSDTAENIVIVVYLLPPVVAEPEPLGIRPSIQGRTSTFEPDEIYVEIDENEVPLAPPDNPNPQTGKKEPLSLYILGLISLVMAVLPFLIRRKRKQTHNDS